MRVSVRKREREQRRSSFGVDGEVITIGLDRRKGGHSGVRDGRRGSREILGVVSRHATSQSMIGVDDLVWTPGGGWVKEHDLSFEVWRG